MQVSIVKFQRSGRLIKSKKQVLQSRDAADSCDWCSDFESERGERWAEEGSSACALKTFSCTETKSIRVVYRVVDY